MLTLTLEPPTSYESSRSPLERQGMLVPAPLVQLVPTLLSSKVMNVLPDGAMRMKAACRNELAVVSSACDHMPSRSDLPGVQPSSVSLNSQSSGESSLTPPMKQPSYFLFGITVVSTRSGSTLTVSRSAGATVCQSLTTGASAVGSWSPSCESKFEPSSGVAEALPASSRVARSATPKAARQSRLVRDAGIWVQGSSGTTSGTGPLEVRTESAGRQRTLWTHRRRRRFA